MPKASYGWCVHLNSATALVMQRQRFLDALITGG